MKTLVEAYKKHDGRGRAGRPEHFMTRGDARRRAYKLFKTHQCVLITSDYDDLGSRRILKMLMRKY